MSTISDLGIPSRLGRGGRELISSEYFTLILCVLYFIAMLPFCPALLTLEALKNMVGAVVPLLTVALGQTFILILGEIDLSATSVIALASVTGASVMSNDSGFLAGSSFAIPIAILTFLIAGCVVGFLNGASVTFLGMPSFIVTLSTRMLFAGTAIWYTTFHTRSSSISNLPPGFTILGQGELYGIPYSAGLVIVLSIGAHYLLTKTTLGRWFFAIGINRRTAAVSGVPVRSVIVAAFVISGLFAALSSILYTARLQTGTPILGERILLDIIGAVVIGGTSLFGGKGKIQWTVFGVTFLVLVSTSLEQLGASQFVILQVKGAVILFAAVLDALRNRFFARS